MDGCVKRLAFHAFDFVTALVAITLFVPIVAVLACMKCVERAVGIYED